MSKLQDLETLFADDFAHFAGLDDLAMSRAKLALPVLEGLALPLDWFPEDIGPAQILPALAALSTLSPELRPTLAAAIRTALQEDWETRREDYPELDRMLAREGASRGFASLQVPQAEADIWRLVRFESIFVEPSPNGTGVNVILCADVAWDEEHQLGLFFRDGHEFLGAADPSSAL